MAIQDVQRKFFPHIQVPPEWGIEPVPAKNRVLGFLDYLVLWGDLGIGLLVMLAGTFLAPGLGLSEAVAAIAIGSVLGCLLLALIGLIGSDNATPTMVLLRPVLGVRGSYLPTLLNVLQLIGWTIFEFIVMGVAADAISQSVFGVSNHIFWITVFALVVVLMGIGGPIGVVRQWLEKFAVWIALATGLWLTFHIVTTYNLAALLQKPGDGSLPFWIAVDLVIALPISWLPLVADYNRFARRSSTAFWGTFVGFLITNFWFLALGTLVLLGANVTQEPKQFATGVALSIGWVILLILLADETHNAWADLYSSAVSVQNIFPKVKQVWLIIGLGVLCYLVALVIDITQFENFLFLTGSFFIPVFGVLAADYFLLRRRKYKVDEFYRERGAFWFSNGVNVWGMAAWVVGIVVYHVTNPTTLGSFFPDYPAHIPSVLTAVGGSLPSFAAAFIAYAILGALAMRLSAGKEPVESHA
ncbi:MAG: putative hydroxymethylpyrimidine transporter CytX [Chloroflexi bacterium]|nr:putative hydroxymethylpyrimidine transporter CytX [Chloroflexota bacterium]MCL5274504.1 putative hydroxymethylpyrimidine transporter CytX [Chloroflexota bacterium]